MLKKNSSSIDGFSWLFSYLLGLDKKDRLDPLPAELMIQLAVFLTINEFNQLQFVNKKSMHKFKETGSLIPRGKQFFNLPLSFELGRLVALEGENNQTRVEQLLKRYSSSSNRALSVKIDMKDPSRDFLMPLSVYGYCFWVGDTDMCLMMQKYMDESTKADVHAECREILEKGLSFKFNNMTEFSDHEPMRSSYFTLDSLIAAHKEFQLAKNNDDTDGMDSAWQKISKETKRLPLCMIQIYCRLHGNERTVNFFQIKIIENEAVGVNFSWFKNGIMHNRGVIMSRRIANSHWHGTHFYSGTPYDIVDHLNDDLSLLLKLQEQRSVHLEKTYDALNDSSIQLEKSAVLRFNGE